MIKAWLLQLQKRLTAQFGSDISTPEARRAAWWHFQLMDHAFLRVLWSNLHQIAPGVYRSNQPSPERLHHWKRTLGLKSILNLRGQVDQGFYLFEAEACRDLDITLHNLRIFAKQPPSREELQELTALFTTMAKPFLIHCKSGSDRTGLAAALYLMLVEHRPIAEAQRQLSLYYLHFAAYGAGVQDHLLRMYAKAQAASAISFADWLATAYDPDLVRQSFQRWQAGDRSLS